METTQLSSEEAEAYVQKVDSDRSEFVRRSFRHDPDSPLNHDLVINTGAISLETGNELALAALENKLHVPRPRR